jgi:hypothetical protein
MLLAPVPPITDVMSQRPPGGSFSPMLKIIVSGCVLAAIAITLKIRIDTPQGPRPLARAIVTTHLQKLRGELALP